MWTSFENEETDPPLSSKPSFPDRNQFSTISGVNNFKLVLVNNFNLFPANSFQSYFECLLMALKHFAKKERDFVFAVLFNCHKTKGSSSDSSSRLVQDAPKRIALPPLCARSHRVRQTFALCDQDKLLYVLKKATFTSSPP